MGRKLCYSEPKGADGWRHKQETVSHMWTGWRCHAMQLDAKRALARGRRAPGRLCRMHAFPCPQVHDMAPLKPSELRDMGLAVDGGNWCGVFVDIPRNAEVLNFVFSDK